MWVLHKYLLNTTLGRVSWWQFLLSDPTELSLSGLQVADLQWPGVSDGSRPPALNLCGPRLEFTTKYPDWAFGMGTVRTLIQTDDRGQKRSREPRQPGGKALGRPSEAGGSSSAQSPILTSPPPTAGGGGAGVAEVCSLLGKGWDSLPA